MQEAVARARSKDHAHAEAQLSRSSAVCGATFQ
jgi:hypothetical protein